MNIKKILELKAKANASTQLEKSKVVKLKESEKSEIIIPPVQLRSKVLPNKLKGRPPPKQDSISTSIELPVALEMLRRSLAVDKDDTTITTTISPTAIQQ